MYIHHYQSPLGSLVLKSDGLNITSLRFIDNLDIKDKTELLIFKEADYWLDSYFKGERLAVLPALKLNGSLFQKRIWQLLLDIPYGAKISYGELAKRYESEYRVNKIACQAVGVACKNNPIYIMVPCHRVVLANGDAGEYGGCRWRKIKLLEMENN